VAIYQNKDTDILAPVKRVVDVFLNPAFVTKKVGDPVTTELLLLSTETGETDFFPTVVPQKVTSGGLNLDMTSSEYEKWSKAQGEYVRKYYIEEIENPAWIDTSPEDKRAILKDILDESKSSLKTQFLKARLKKANEQNPAQAEAMLNLLSETDYKKLTAS
jgi:hypothetical protein